MIITFYYILFLIHIKVLSATCCLMFLTRTIRTHKKINTYIMVFLWTIKTNLKRVRAKKGRGRKKIKEYALKKQPIK